MATQKRPGRNDVDLTYGSDSKDDRRQAWSEHDERNSTFEQDEREMHRMGKKSQFKVGPSHSTSISSDYSYPLASTYSADNVRHQRFYSSQLAGISCVRAVDLIFSPS